MSRSVGASANARRVQGKVILLLSGGVDSAACAALLLGQEASIRCLYIDYGQAAAAHEESAAKAITKFYRLPLTVCRWTGCESKSEGMILGRNAFLLFAALMEMRQASGSIAIGIHAGTPYFDCGPNFRSDIQALIQGYSSGRITIQAPFESWTKGEIWQFCQDRKVPLELTYSCERGKDPVPCGECASCKDLKALREVQNQ